MISELTWNERSFLIDGKPASLISGEFHYFRVPRSDWRERLILLKESGANAVATYIPWIIHEPREGEILFDDIPERSLTEFLCLCEELELMVIARPGPYAYSELRNSGLPLWLTDSYPEILARTEEGKIAGSAISYLHPTFLEKARIYIRSVNAVLRPHLHKNGGCIVSMQADNEIGGIHVWSGYLDCNPEAMGFGKEDGHYVRFLREKYSSVAVLSTRYGTSYESFCDVQPYKNTPCGDSVEAKRCLHDYRDFYRHTLELYIQTICAWFREDGMDVDVCVNAGSPALIPIMRNIPSQNKESNLFMGVDHYYALFPRAGISMTPEKAVNYLFSLDMLEELGMPPLVLEMQSGSASCYPPILPENALGFYMTHVALGMKGSNYYIFTGGPNYADTGANADIYDYHAPVSADGEVRPLYYAQRERNEFSHENQWMLSISRSFDVQFGFTWEGMQDLTTSRWNRTEQGISLKKSIESVQLPLALAGCLVKCKEIGGELSTDKPLVVVTDGRMAREKQESLIRFVQNGGKLLLTPTIPTLDEDLMPCTVLRDFLGVTEIKAVTPANFVLLANEKKVYNIEKCFSFTGFGGEVLGRNGESGEAIIEYKSIGSGAVLLMGTEYGYSLYCQQDMLLYCLHRLGYEKLIETNCRELMVTLFENGDRATCFLINQLAGSVSAEPHIQTNGKHFSLGKVSVPAMSTVPVELI